MQMALIFKYVTQGVLEPWTSFGLIHPPLLVEPRMHHARRLSGCRFCI